MSENLRSAAARREDVLAHLSNDEDLWIATCSPKGRVHLVPLSFCYADEQIVLATPSANLTARNIERNPSVRLALGTTRDVVVIDGEAELESVGAIKGELAAAFLRQGGWDPRSNPDNVIIRVRPLRIQAWRDEAELEGRVIMSKGKWTKESERIE